MIFCLVVSRVVDIETGTLGLGYLNRKGTHDAFNVVFVVPNARLENGFERIGRGAIFGKEAEAAFANAVEREVRLI